MSASNYIAGAAASMVTKRSNSNSHGTTTTTSYSYCHRQTRKSPIWKSVCAGAGAGALTMATLYPLDIWKTKVQASSSSSSSFNSSSSISSSSITSSNGLKSLSNRCSTYYRGFSIAFVNQVMGKTVFFSIYESTKRRMKSSSNHGTALIGDISAALCATMGNLIVETPLECAKQRLQVVHNNQIKIWPCFVLRNASYTGTTPFIARELLFKSLQYPLFDHFKRVILASKSGSTNSSNSSLSLLESGVCGALAACLCGLITMPFDVVKTRQMTANTTTTTGLGFTTAATATTTTLEDLSFGGFLSGPKALGRDLVWIAREEGWQSLFRGTKPRLLWMTGAGFIFFSTYEQLQQRL